LRYINKVNTIEILTKLHYKKEKLVRGKNNWQIFDILGKVFSPKFLGCFICIISF